MSTTPSSASALPIAARSDSARVVGQPVPGGTNLALIRGEIRRDPEFVTLATGEEVLVCDITVRGAATPAESVPVVWIDPPLTASRLSAGDDVVVVGRIRRRFFRAGGSTASRTELCADRILRARAVARVRAAVGAALAPIDAD